MDGGSNSMARIGRYLLALLLFVAGGGFLLSWAFDIGANAPSAELEREGTVVTYEEFPVVTQTFSNGISLVGLTAPKREEVVYIPPDIEIDEIIVNIGEYVAAGRQLVRLDARSYTASAGNIKASYLEQLRHYNLARTWDRSPEIQRLRNSLAEAELRLQQSKQTLISVESLLAKGLVPRQEFEVQRLTVMREEFAAENTRHELDVRLQDGQETLAIAELRYQAAKGAWERFHNTYPDSYIRAPISGYVGRPPIPGKGTQTDPDNAGPERGEPIFTILGTERLLVQAYVGETDVNHIAIGQPVAVREIGGSSVDIAGRIAAISRVNSAGNRSRPRFELLIEIDPATLGDSLRFGMSATVFIRTYEKADAILIPLSALHDDGQGPYVLVKAPSIDAPAKRPVAVGRATVDSIVVHSGLSQGDVVMVPEQTGHRRHGRLSPAAAAHQQPTGTEG